MTSLPEIVDIYLENEKSLRQRLDDDQDSYQKFITSFDINKINAMADCDDLLDAIDKEWPSAARPEPQKIKINLLAEAKKPFNKVDHLSHSELLPSEMLSPKDLDQFKEPKRFSIGYSGGVKINSSPKNYRRDSPMGRTISAYPGGPTLTKGLTIAASNGRDMARTSPPPSMLTKGLTLGEGKSSDLSVSKSREIIECKSNVQFNLEGEKTINQYVFKQHLGKGAFGVVELVIDQSTGIEYVRFSDSRPPNVKV
jgi:hypothetical protein